MCVQLRGGSGSRPTHSFQLSLSPGVRWLVVGSASVPVG